MKAENFILVSHEVKKNLINRIMDIECDSKTKVTISNAGSKSQKQRGLQWRWYSEVAEAGIGSADTKERVHLESKYRWAIPILLRDDEIFVGIYEHFTAHYLDNKDMMMQFVDDYVHTERFNVSQMVEYLTDFERYWLEKGVNLTNPDLYGIILK